MKNEILNYLSDFMNAWTFIDLTLITFFAWLAFFYRQTWKKQSLIDSGIIARNAIRMNNQEIDAELLKDYRSRNKELSTSIFQKETFITELKKSFEDVVAELKKIKSENELLEACNQENLKQIAYLKAVKNHKKRPVFEPEVKEWEYIGSAYNPYAPDMVKNGNKYLVSDVKIEFNKETSICIVCENGGSVIADKAFFTPVK